MRRSTGRGVLALASVLVGGCTVDVADICRPGQGDCGGGRVCVEGRCVTPDGGGGADAAGTFDGSVTPDADPRGDASPPDPDAGRRADAAPPHPDADTAPGDAGPPTDARPSTGNADAPDARPDPDAFVIDECESGEWETRPCGRNGRGTETRNCVDGAWSPWSACDDTDECTDGERETRPCGHNHRRVETRRCLEGAWTGWSACDDPDECLDGDEEFRACGFNDRGTETRRCAAGAWSDWSACDDPDECLDGDEESRACGLNGRGTETRQCDAGRWSAWACDDPDVCVDGTEGPCPEPFPGVCGPGTALCVEGRWGECRPAAEPSSERCNELDDDCDHAIDEDFDLLTDPLHCGACGVACAAPRVAEGVCVDGACTVGACEAGWRDEDERFDNGCECAPEDEPDPLFVDANCDGVDGDLSRAVFVSARHGDDAVGTGAVSAPLRTLERALEAATAGGLRRPIYLDVGTYRLERTLTVPAGVSIHGGYLYDGDRGWARGPRTINETVITGVPVVLRYQALDRPTLLDNVTVRATDAVEGGASIGVVAAGVGEHLLVREALVAAGAGGAGVAGTPGTPGEPGGAGQRGEGTRPGAGGTNPSCPHGTGGGGGGEADEDGLDGERLCPDRHGCEPARGGLEGGDWWRDDGQDGDDGARGFHGQNGAPASPDGRIGADLTWWPAPPGDAGTTGWPGGGGGGGGGGNANPTANAGSGGGGGGGNANPTANAGSGGGAGGCPGDGGSPGTGGGGSFALIVAGGTVRVDASNLVSGPGGPGGAAGPGGPGGVGGSGGGNRCSGDCNDGGPGGDGGDGGCGGHGAPGAGGPSFAVLRVSPDAEPGSLTASRIEIVGDAAATRLIPGEPGAGGAPGEAPSCDPGPPGLPGHGGAIGCCQRDADGFCDPLDTCE